MRRERFRESHWAKIRFRQRVFRALKAYHHGDHERAMSAYAEWLRFDRYEVADGYVRPARDARVERYNPWDDYWAAVKPGAKRPPPYQSLLELADDLEIRRGNDRLWLTPDNVAALIAWCSEHGLLGWLPHSSISLY